MRASRGFWAVFVIVLLLSVDQALKIWIKTHLALGDSIRVTDWFYLRFVENNGMAMGIEVIGKLFLSLLRIVASGAIVYYLFRIVRRGFSMG
jgi:signal peptidase II